MEGRYEEEIFAPKDIPCHEDEISDETDALCTETEKKLSKKKLVYCTISRTLSTTVKSPA